MQCPHCGYSGRGFLIGRGKEPAPFDIIRYRKCVGCDRTYMTREVLVDPAAEVLPFEPHGRLARHDDD